MSILLSRLARAEWTPATYRGSPERVDLPRSWRSLWRKRTGPLIPAFRIEHRPEDIETSTWKDLLDLELDQAVRRLRDGQDLSPHHEMTSSDRAVSLIASRIRWADGCSWTEADVIAAFRSPHCRDWLLDKVFGEPLDELALALIKKKRQTIFQLSQQIQECRSVLAKIAADTTTSPTSQSPESSGDHSPLESAISGMVDLSESQEASH